MIVVLLSGCTTLVRVNAVDPNGEQIYDARVLLDGEFIGETPDATVEVSNFIGETPEIRVTKDGYNSRSIEPKKEIKMPALIAGIFVWVPLLWVWGPKARQTVVLTPSTR